MRLALLACLAGSALPADAAAPPGQWWNAGFTKRQKLNLTAGATAIPTQYSVRLQIDHASLVSLGQSLASGNDVRIAWWSGTAWVELDRLLDDESSWNNAATRVWFRTQAAIGASATDDNYYLYYGSRPENQADYLVIGPQSFLDAAEPLLAHRRSQGLVSRAVSTEEVFQEFGHGESRPEALKAFLEYAYHHWEQPSPRYVLLLGDATYDPKDYLQTGVVNRVPAFTIKTSYLWTVSDPALAAVNGEDLVPDLAIGRLSAASVDEVPVLVEKVLAFEGVGRNLEGAAALVADNPDLAGDFEANANEIASTILAARDPERIFVRERGTATRAAIVGALDGGLSLLSYVGHGATAVWAGENVFNDWDVPTLAPQPRQPLLLTLNCLNGFFHFPPLDSLAEAMVKAEGKGAIAALSPSGLSLDAPAHAFHKAVLREVASGGHQRLGDAVLAAQQAYANEGALLELLSIYHLLGDPALRIR